LEVPEVPLEDFVKSADPGDWIYGLHEYILNAVRFELTLSKTAPSVLVNVSSVMLPRTAESMEEGCIIVKNKRHTVRRLKHN
jgi:peptide deformylase